MLVLLRGVLKVRSIVYLLCSHAFAGLLACAAIPAIAATAVNSATVNGAVYSAATPYNATPGEILSVTINVTKSGGGNWRSYGATVGGAAWAVGTNCFNQVSPANGTYVRSFTTVTPAIAGTYNITFATFTNSNCGGTGGTLSWTGAIVVKANQTITFGAQAAQTYSPGGTFVISPLATASSGLVVTYSSLTPAVCTVAGTTVTMVTAGTCTIAADQAGDASYYPAPQVTQNVTINPVSSLDHIAIEHASGQGLTCTPSTLTIKACLDASCSVLYTGGVTGTLTATGTPAVNWVGGAGFSIPNGGSSITKDVQVTTPGSVVFGTQAGSVVPTPALATTCAPSCTFTSADAGLLFDVSHHVSEALQNITVSAVKKADNSLSCVPAFGSVGKNVVFTCSYANPASGTLPVRVGGQALNAANNAGTACDGTGQTLNLAFDASGVAGTTVQYADVGSLTLSAQYSGSGADAGLVMTGADTFVVKPDHFDLSTIRQTAAPNLANPAAADAAGNRFVMAGEQFSVTVTARNALGNATPNYGQETAAESVKLTPALAGGLGLSNNPAIGGTFGAFSNGVATGTAFTWNEAGIITLTPSVADADYLGAGDITGTASGNVGRFHAAKFVLSGGVIANRTGLAGCPAPAGCGTFTYMGEQMSAVFNLTAKAVDGTTMLQNYNHSATPANNFAKLDPTATGNPLALAAVDTGTPRTVATLDTTTYGVASGSFAGGIATVTVPFAVTRGGSAYGPFDALDVGVNPVDGDGAALAALDLAVNAGGAPNTHGLVASTKARYGRMKLSNAHGSELLTLAINVAAQHWDGTTYVTNILDNDTTFAATDVVFGNYTKNLNATNYPNSGATVVTPVSVVFVNGAASYKLAKPGAGNNGSVDMTVNALSAYLPSNAARATFGVYKGNNEFIYLREAY